STPARSRRGGGAYSSPRRLQEFFGSVAHLRRGLGRGARALEIGEGGFLRAQPVIEHAELELHLGLVGVDQQQPLERGDRAFDVADLDGQIGEACQRLWIRRLLERRLEGLVIRGTLGRRRFGWLS